MEPDSRVHCPIAESCGGCALIGRPCDEQLRLKRDRVVGELRAFDRLHDLEVAGCRPAPWPTGYRNRAKLAVASSDDGVHLGLYARGTNRIVDLAPCVVQRDIVQRSLAPLRGWLADHGLARPLGPVIYADVRECVASRCHLTLVVSDVRDSGFDPALLPLDDLQRRWPDLDGVAINFGSTDSSYPMGHETRTLRGSGRFRAPAYEIGGENLAFDVPAAGFFQVAPELLRDVHAAMRDHLGEEGPLLDLYCGVGVHGLVLAGRAGTRGRSLVGIDESVAAIDCARRNAARMGVAAEYHAARVEDVVGDPAIVVAGSGGARPRVVLNPGRAGCRPAVLDALVAGGPSRVAYLSCNPATLARDLDRAVGGGMRVSAVVPLDLMPQTDQVETLALLES